MAISFTPAENNARGCLDPAIISTRDDGALFAAVDVHYTGGGARAALVASPDAAFTTVTDERVVELTGVAPYEPGFFHRRELPALAAVLDAVPLGLLIVDGYVDLDPHGRPGLGAHARELFGVPVIGVAKTAFRAATHARTVLRGSASRPLYVTAAGIPVNAAADLVRRMAGVYRLPEALKRVDALARGRATPTSPG